MSAREMFEGEMGCEPPEQMQEGDIFTWRWTDEEYARREKQCGSTVYWCRSRIAVVKEGVLRDTYWSSGSDEVLNTAYVVLTFQGNPADMKLIHRAEKVFYRPEDVVDMGHSNNSGAPCYAKGERDPETMKRYYEYKRDCFESDAHFILGRCRDIRCAIAAIEAGSMDYQFPCYS